MNHFKQENMEVQYKQIEGYPDYLIGNDGSVISNSKHGNSNRRVLTPRNNKGYVSVALFNEKGRTDVSIHRLVGRYFVDGYEDGLTINHKDCNKKNNHYTNLEWVTHAENIKHRDENNLRIAPKGIECTNSKLNDDDVRRIRELHSTGKYTHKQIAKMYLMDRSSISDVINRASWKHIV
jgi:hypothetical protein